MNTQKLIVGIIILVGLITASTCVFGWTEGVDCSNPFIGLNITNTTTLLEYDAT